MHNAEGGSVSARSNDRNSVFGLIVSEIVSLVENVKASIKRIDSAIAMEPSHGHQEGAADFVVLDDVTPCYQNARATLNACGANLEVTLHLLHDNETSQPGGGRSAVCESPAIRLVDRA
jgi:hypothetical protein